MDKTEKLSKIAKPFQIFSGQGHIKGGGFRDQTPSLFFENHY